MTTLDCRLIKRTRKWAITKHIAGDLSFDYEVRPRNWVKLLRDGTVDYCAGYGIPANKISDTKKIIDLCNKYDYKKAQEIWRKKYVHAGSRYSFGFLTGAEAKKYAVDEDAYGDYAMKMRGLSKKKKRKKRAKRVDMVLTPHGIFSGKKLV